MVFLRPLPTNGHRFQTSRYAAKPPQQVSSEEEEEGGGAEPEGATRPTSDWRTLSSLAHCELATVTVHALALLLCVDRQLWPLNVRICLFALVCSQRSSTLTLRLAALAPPLRPSASPLHASTLVALRHSLQGSIGPRVTPPHSPSHTADMPPAKSTAMEVDEQKHAQPAAAAATAAAAPVAARPRMVIQKMVLHNFKSYAGTKEIGPFHKVSTGKRTATEGPMCARCFVFVLV